jgi:mxaJ protein
MRRLAVLVGAFLLCTAATQGGELRVCADPNNLPFSNDKGEGFENKIVELIARDLGATVVYTWWAQRRGFVRNTLRAQECDLWPGIASGIEMVVATRPYYRSTYVFVTRSDRHLDISSFDDPRLRTLTIGVQMVGNAMNTPPAHALARRGTATTAARTRRPRSSMRSRGKRSISRRFGGRWPAISPQSSGGRWP